MDPITATQHTTKSPQDSGKQFNTLDTEEDDAIRKVEAATTPDLLAQNGVRNVEAVTLSWTKTSLACAFVWYVAYLSNRIHQVLTV